MKSLFYSTQVTLNLSLKFSCLIMVNIPLFPIYSGYVLVPIIGLFQHSSDHFLLDKIIYDLVTKIQN